MVLVQSISFVCCFMRVTGKLVSSSKLSDNMSHYRHKLKDITEAYVIRSKFCTVINVRYQKTSECRRFRNVITCNWNIGFLNSVRNFLPYIVLCSGSRKLTMD